MPSSTCGSRASRSRRWPTSMAWPWTRSRRSAEFMPATPPEFFLDRGLGRRVAERLVELGWVVHRAADHFPNDAQHVADEDWLAYGLDRGWSPLCKDGRIHQATCWSSNMGQSRHRGPCS
ncbi:hypothetical protein [Actinokineospora enzanensis]|uniref:PIN-like domain-containing protein n=1 Tax=Actinokineospora enzanensis TaxID=155975 RepID=UPI003CCC3A32